MSSAGRPGAAVGPPESFDVTVIVPAHDAGSTLATTLRSVADQRRPPAAVVVVDDGSAAPVRLAERGLPVEVLRQANRGPAVARNRAAARAETEWVAFLDADDLWHPERLGRLAAWVAAHPEASWVATSFRDVLFEDDMTPELARNFPQALRITAATAASRLAAQRLPSSVLSVPVEVLSRARLLSRNHIGSSGAVLVRREAFLAAGGIPTHVMGPDDLLGWINLARLVDVHLVDDPTFYYRRSAGQMSRRRQVNENHPMLQLASLAAVVAADGQWGDDAGGADPSDWQGLVAAALSQAAANRSWSQAQRVLGSAAVLRPRPVAFTRVVGPSLPSAAKAWWRAGRSA